MAKGCTVYVGNIDFDTPEAKLLEELSQVGKVVSFRMVTDKQTGRSKGYGFCEYESSLIAEAAVRELKINLNNRTIKINYADTDYGTSKKEVEVPVDNFINVIKQMDRNNLKEVILYLKRMAVDQPTKLKTLLDENPNLGLALFQCLIELELVDKETVYELIKKNFDLEDNKMKIFERICQMTDEDLSVYDEKTKDKINTIRNNLLKNKN
ncbi:Cleavage stimulation factor subunit 2 tau [Conglomerata obtusa]